MRTEEKDKAGKPRRGYTKDVSDVSESYDGGAELAKEKEGPPRLGQQAGMAVCSFVAGIGVWMDGDDIYPESISSTQIEDSSVTSAKIQDGTITNTDLAVKYVAGRARIPTNEAGQGHVSISYGVVFSSPPVVVATGQRQYVDVHVVVGDITSTGCTIWVHHSTISNIDYPVGWVAVGQ